MRKLMWLLVVAFLVWFFFIRTGSGDFGCNATGIANAATGDCPPNLETAAHDPSWAADRLAGIADRPATVGLAYDEDGAETEFSSGEDEDADRVSEILREEGIGYPRTARSHPASSHVETKVAAHMRDEDLSFVVLVINNESGACAGILSCQSVLRAVLPPGARLVVWSKKTIRVGEPEVFTGD